jgi:serine/threonine protein kinase
MQNYRQLQMLGSGAYAKVFLAQKIGTTQYVAIKRVDAQKMISTGQNLQSEINLLKRIHHFNIVECYESFQDNNEICIVMEYIDGSNLRVFLHKCQSPLQEAFIRKLIYQLFSAIIYLHNMGIIHRDIKPENILITQTGDIKVSDFGLSFVVDSIRFSPQSYVGTENYMSPEMIQKKPYSYPTDVWSLGCVIFEILTFHHPFGSNMFEIIQNITNGKMYPFLFPISVDLQNLVKLMLIPLPENRISLNQVVDLGFGPSSFKLLYEQLEVQKQEIKVLQQKVEFLEAQNQQINLLQQKVALIEAQN